MNAQAARRSEQESPAAVRGLLEKYRVMRELRQARGAPSRETLRDLARRFPSALAEIDRIAPALLHHRIEELEAIVAGDEAREWRPGSSPALPDWVRGWLLTHARLRGALAVKAWLAGRRTVDDATRARFATEPFSEEARAWSDRLDDIADPPGGRLVALVYSEVAQALGVPPAEVRTLLMPRP